MYSFHTWDAIIALAKRYQPCHFRNILRWLSATAATIMYALTALVAFVFSHRKLTINLPYDDPTTADIILAVLSSTGLALIPCVATILGHLAGPRIGIALSRDHFIDFVLCGIASVLGLILTAVRESFPNAYGADIANVDRLALLADASMCSPLDRHPHIPGIHRPQLRVYFASDGNRRCHLRHAQLEPPTANTWPSHNPPTSPAPPVIMTIGVPFPVPAK